MPHGLLREPQDLLRELAGLPRKPEAPFRKQQGLRRIFFESYSVSCFVSDRASFVSHRPFFETYRASFVSQEAFCVSSGRVATNNSRV